MLVHAGDPLCAHVPRDEVMIVGQRGKRTESAARIVSSQSLVETGRDDSRHAGSHGINDQLRRPGGLVTAYSSDAAGFNWYRSRWSGGRGSVDNAESIVA